MHYLHIKNSLLGKLLRINFDYNVNILHIEDFCQKASKKLNAIAKLAPYMTSLNHILMTLFSKSQFDYCFFIWICWNSSLNSKINRLHEPCLHIVYNDKKSILKNFFKEMVHSLLTIKISDF